MVHNKALIYKKVPEELPVIGEHIAVEDWPIDVDSDLKDGSVLVKNYMSVDPYMRGRLREPGTKSYAPSYELGHPLETRSIATVVKSKNPSFKEGDIVSCNAPMAEYAIITKEVIEGPHGPWGPPLAKVDNPNKINVAHFLGAVGMPGLTAYSSYYDIGEPKKGETIFVTAAAGAVGQLVCQLALHDGLDVIASAGDDEKVKFLIEEVGVKKSFNYKKRDTAEALREFAPNGIDIFYDNVGGKTLDDALEVTKDFARIIACGMISQYNLKPEDRYGIKNTVLFFQRQLKMQGFLVASIGPKYADEHRENVSKWIAEGTFKPTLSVTEGIEKSGEAILSIFKGENLGKAVIKVSD